LTEGRVNAKYREPSQYPLVFILLIIIAIMTAPWYAHGPTFEHLVLSIPVWVWSVILWSFLLAISIILVSKYLWTLEPENEEVEE